MLYAIFHGILLAFGLILPLGVQNVFIFNQGATQPKYIKALPVVITAGLCDTLLISLAVLGVSVIVYSIPIIKFIIVIIGVCFLIFMGYITWKSKPVIQKANAKALSTKKQVMFAASVSLLNPHAILDTIGVIGTSSLIYSGGEKLSFTLSCIIISWIWFLSLALLGRQVGKLDKTGKIIIILNKVSALIMWITAFYLSSTLFNN